MPGRADHTEGRAPLTRRQRAVLAAIRELLRASGTAPTLREIRDHLGLRSIGAVQDHVAALGRKGYVRRRRGAARGLMPADEPAPAHLVPVLGRVPAGMPVLADEHVEGWIPVGGPLPEASLLFGLRVSGDSMVGAGILDGDVVIVRQQDEAHPGDLVVARIEDEATVKRLAHRGGRWFLEPENDAYRPIPFDEKPGGICGKVVGVWRRLP